MEPFASTAKRRSTRSATIKSVEKAVQILRILSLEPMQGVSDLSRRTRIPKGTLFAFLKTLVAEGLVIADGRLRYSLGPGVLALGQAFLDKLTLREVARPFLERLAEVAREVVHLTVFSDGEMVYIDRIQTRSVVQVGSRVGGRCPFHCTGVGKAYAAFLPDDETQRLVKLYRLKKYTPRTITSLRRLRQEFRQIREQGYSIDRSEHDPEVRCVGAPIFDHRGQAVASISVAGPAYRMTAAKIKKTIPPVLETAAGISSRLAYTAPPVPCE